ncbi:MAG TPA: 50S ribosomal protein L29 [Clostridia bacterium]|jgi:large subunit ribosomal protein L29|nr:50S ribosomal protein L29 [Clostridia bacterium]
MKVSEIRDLTTEELITKVGDLKRELFNLRFQLATGQLDNTGRIKEVKKSIARAKTVLRERELREGKAQ